MANIVLGIATLRAKILPRWCRAVPLLQGLVPTSYIAVGIFIVNRWDGYWEIFGSGFMIVLALFGLGWVMVGSALWLENRPRPSTHPSMTPTKASPLAGGPWETDNKG